MWLRWSISYSSALERDKGKDLAALQSEIISDPISRESLLAFDEYNKWENVGNKLFGEIKDKKIYMINENDSRDRELVWSTYVNKDDLYKYDKEIKNLTAENISESTHIAVFLMTHKKRTWISLTYRILDAEWIPAMQNKEDALLLANKINLILSQYDRYKSLTQRKRAYDAPIIGKNYAGIGKKGEFEDTKIPVEWSETWTKYPWVFEINKTWAIEYDYNSKIRSVASLFWKNNLWDPDSVVFTKKELSQFTWLDEKDATVALRDYLNKRIAENYYSDHSPYMY